MGPPRVEENQLPVQVTPELLITGVIVVAVVLLVVAVVVAVAYWRLKRSGRLRVLTAKAEAQLLPPGAKRDLADLRLELQESLAAATSSAALGAGSPLSRDLQGLTSRLTASAAPLLDRMSQARTLPDSQLERLLPTLFTQVRTVQRVAERILAAADDVTTGQADHDLRQLLADADDEVGAVEQTLAAYRDLTDDPHRQP